MVIGNHQYRKRKNNESTWQPLQQSLINIIQKGFKMSKQWRHAKYIRH